MDYHRTGILWYLFLLKQQSNFFKRSFMCAHACGNIDARGFQRGMPQEIGKVGQVFFHGIETACKQVAQVVREHFGRINMGRTAKPLHIVADVGAVQGAAAARAENRAALNPVFCCIA